MVNTLKRLGFVLLTIVAAVAVVVAYVAARHLIFWSPSEEVVFQGGAVQLAGTLVKPSADGVFPGVVLLHGSGPEPRADPPTRAVVNALVDGGFAVLIYDKRGAGASGGDFESAGYRDFINDAVAGVEYLAARPDVDGSRIGLYTVSESGWFAPEIAVNTGRIKFVFNKVGAPLSVVDTVRWELRNDYLTEGIAESDVQALVDLTVRTWTYYQAAAENPELASGPEREAINQHLARLRREIPMADTVIPTELLPYDAVRYAQIAADLFYDPAPYLDQLAIPFYYAYGELDVNIPTAQCVTVLEEMIETAGKDISIAVYPGVGHGLGTWKGLFDVGFPSGYLDTVRRWTSAQVKDQ